MSELRQDPISSRWVVIAKDRAGRPDEFQPAPFRRVAATCPFCFGHEDETPLAVATYPPDTVAGERWKVRVVPNRYPAVKLDERPAPESHLPFALGESRGGFGVHEVIIESPDHAVSFTELSDELVEWTFAVYRDRLQTLARDRRFRYAQIFKNVGALGCASIEHIHSQLVATNFVPADMQTELNGSRAWHDRTGACPFCQLIEAELAAGLRIVSATERCVAFCPYASRFPYETWVLPRRHASQFEKTEAGELGEAARFVRDIIGRIERASGRSAYNYFLHTSPFDAGPLDHYHWHVEIFPRITTAAGYEWATGCFINPVPPEDAAAKLSTP